MSEDGLWYDDLCSLEKNFVCEDVNDTIAFWRACPIGWDLISKKCYKKGKLSIKTHRITSLILMLYIGELIHILQLLFKNLKVAFLLKKSY